MHKYMMMVVGITLMKIWLFAKRAFMTFWYPYVRMLNSIWPSITIQGKRLVVFPDVYKPLENEHACAEYCREGDKVLDLGCGSGVAAVFCAPKVRELLAVDISPSAVRNTEENCRLNKLSNVAVKQSDMFSCVEGKFDLILADPPYIEAEFEKEEEQFATSTRYLPILFSQVGKHLAGDGRLLIQYPIWFRGDDRKTCIGARYETIGSSPFALEISCPLPLKLTLYAGWISVGLLPAAANARKWTRRLATFFCSADRCALHSNLADLLDFRVYNYHVSRVHID